MVKGVQHYFEAEDQGEPPVITCTGSCMASIHINSNNTHTRTTHTLTRTPPIQDTDSFSVFLCLCSVRFHSLHASFADVDHVPLSLQRRDRFFTSLRPPLLLSHCSLLLFDVNCRKALSLCGMLRTLESLCEVMIMHQKAR